MPTSLLDLAALPVEELSALALREGRRPRPIYQAHRWFARRFGSVFRALLTAAASPADADFWQAYYAGVDWSGRTVCDPFVGGGTSVVEAQRLGADVVGVDVDAVACAITRFETSITSVPDLGSALASLKETVGAQLAPFYRTATPDGERQVLHFFWVQVIGCRGCGREVEAHPHYQLAFEAEGKDQWVFCPECHAVERLSRSRRRFSCGSCSARVVISRGTADQGDLVCPHCRKRERIIEASAREGRPRWRLFGLETLEADHGSRPVPMRDRCFRPATDHDQAIFAEAALALDARRGLTGSALWVPEREIPSERRADTRLLHYGYRHYRELFNDRQLLHLSCLAEALDGLEPKARTAMAIAFSDHLTTNCMMTYYAFGWRRLAPLFALRAYRHVTRPVEINPWLDGTGRGTFPNAVRQVARAAAWARSPKEPAREGDFKETPVSPAAGAARVRVRQASAAKLTFLPDACVDFVLTDPPYFDNIAYSELSDFYLPWLQQFGLVRGDRAAEKGLRMNLAAKGRGQDDADRFEVRLGECFREVTRVMRPGARLAFTYQHHTPRAWRALAGALAHAGIRPIQIFPLLGDSAAGLHKDEGNSVWDAVFVAVKGRPRRRLGLTAAALAAAHNHYVSWTLRLETGAPCGFGSADRLNFYRACLVAVVLGYSVEGSRPANGRETCVTLDDALALESPPAITETDRLRTPATPRDRSSAQPARETAQEPRSSRPR